MRLPMTISVTVLASSLAGQLSLPTTDPVVNLKLSPSGGKILVETASLFPFRYRGYFVDYEAKSVLPLERAGAIGWIDDQTWVCIEREGLNDARLIKYALHEGVVSQRASVTIPVPYRFSTGSARLQVDGPQLILHLADEQRTWVLSGSDVSELSVIRMGKGTRDPMRRVPALSHLGWKASKAGGVLKVVSSANTQLCLPADASNHGVWDFDVNAKGTHVAFIDRRGNLVVLPLDKGRKTDGEPDYQRGFEARLTREARAAKQ